MGVGIDGMAVTKQVHGNQVRIVTEKDRHVCMSEVPYEADGIVSNVKGLPILCMVADCVAGAAVGRGTFRGRGNTLRLAQLRGGIY